MVELIFVHGALVRDGRWWWQPSAELLLERAGVHSRSLAMPSCGETSPEQVAGGLSADAAALRAELDAVDSAIVVAHSYGGTVVAEAGAHPSVAGILYVSSYLPDVGLAQGAIMSEESDPVSIRDNGDGTVAVDGYDAASFGARFLHDADESVQHDAWGRVTSQAVGSFITPTTAAGWQGVDSTYVVCADDRTTSPDLQRSHAKRASRSVEVATGHHPSITRPDLIVDQVVALMES